MAWPHDLAGFNALDGGDHLNSAAGLSDEWGPPPFSSLPDVAFLATVTRACVWCPLE